MPQEKTHAALLQPVKVKPSFRGVVMPYKPRIDKIAAYEVLHTHNERQFEVIEQWAQNDVSPEQFTAWRNDGLYPIDLADRKYHKANLPSACEFVVRHFDIERKPGVALLLDLVNENNRDGSLKKGKYAVPQMLQDMYELSDDPEFHLGIITHVADVVQCFLHVENGVLERPEDGLYETFRDFVKEFRDCKDKDGNYRPFSLGRYLRDQWLIGTDVAEITKNLEFWTRNYETVRKEKAVAAEAFKAYPRQSEFMAGGKKGIVLKTDDRFFVQAAVGTGEFAYRVIVGSKGHVTVTTHRIDLSSIAQKLSEKEPGRWYYQEAMFSLINGGPQYVDTLPTRMSYVMIVDLLQETFGRPKFIHRKK